MSSRLTPEQADALVEIVQPITRQGVLGHLLLDQRESFYRITLIAQAVLNPTLLRQLDAPVGEETEVMAQMSRIESRNTQQAQDVAPALLTTMQDALRRIRQVLGADGPQAEHVAHASDPANEDHPSQVGANGHATPASGATRGQPVFRTIRLRQKPGPTMANGLAHPLSQPLESLMLQPEEAALARELGIEVAGDALMEKAWNRILTYGPSDMVMLLRGASGSGKEPMARAVHDVRLRAGLNPKKKPMVSINCAALNGGIVESELFGHVKGAFTGATHDRKGKFEEADGGTLLLDEVGDMPRDQQAKLLRVLEDGCITRAGGNTSIPVKVKVVCATNRPLEELVQAGQFREDLFQRLKACQVNLPLWNDRTTVHRKGVAEMALMSIAERYRKKHALCLDDEAMLLLLQTSFPGNIREMKHLLERAYITASQGKAEGGRVVIGQALLASCMDDNSSSIESGRLSHGDIQYGSLERNGEGYRLPLSVAFPPKGGLDGAKKAFGELLIRKALDLSGDNAVASARLLGTSRRTVVINRSSVQGPHSESGPAEEDDEDA